MSEFDIRAFSNRPDPWRNLNGDNAVPRKTARGLVKEGLANLKPADQIALLMAALDIPTKRLLLQELYRTEVSRNGFDETQVALRAALSKNFFSADCNDGRRSPGPPRQRYMPRSGADHGRTSKLKSEPCIGDAGDLE